ncbi:MAG: adhesin [Methanobacteriaceae archaeon]|jgi:hypothetical protein|nr:adhesin [Methanobacteriaceae archaeon]
MKKPKFTLVDYLIIIGIICAIGFAFIHIATDNEEESVSFDSSTLNKIGEKYLSFYKEGKVVKTTVTGQNATNNQEIEVTGEVEWIDEGKSSSTKILINSNGNRLIAGLYEDVPEADIYIEQISLETTSEKYNNITDVTLKPKNINQINELLPELDNNTYYEITTTIALDEVDDIKVQELLNNLSSENKRVSIKPSTSGLENQLIITRATQDEINTANDLLESQEGVSEEIIVRIYNSTPEDINIIKNDSNVKNIREIS